MRTRRVLPFVALSLAAVLTAAACSSGSSSAATSSTTGGGGPSQFCTQLQGVQDSYQSLVDTNVATDGVQQLKSNFDAFLAQLGDLKTAAGSRFAGDISKLQSATSSLGSAIDGVVNGGGSVADLTSSLAGVKTSWDALVTSTSTACPQG